MCADLICVYLFSPESVNRGESGIYIVKSIPCVFSVAKLFVVGVATASFLLKIKMDFCKLRSIDYRCRQIN